MIYPDVSLKEWLEKYPDLSSEPFECANCGKSKKLTRPFVEKGYVGVEYTHCCGSRAHVRIPTSPETLNKWMSALKMFEVEE